MLRRKNEVVMLLISNVQSGDHSRILAFEPHGKHKLILTLPSVVNAQFTFTTNNGAITIAGYSGSDVDVTIPDTINGLPVTSIGNYAFQYQQITTVKIPSGVTNVGIYVFANCTNLTG